MEIEVPTVNFVVFPVVQTLTSRPLRNALYESYCYINNTVVNSASSISQVCPDEMMELPQFQSAKKSTSKNLSRDSVQGAIRSVC